MEKREHGKEAVRVETGGNVVWIRFRENETPGVRENVRGILKQSHEERLSEDIAEKKKIS